MQSEIPSGGAVLIALLAALREEREGFSRGEIERRMRAQAASPEGKRLARPDEKATSPNEKPRFSLGWPLVLL
ncbi:MAG TPA: hypothetical protein VFM98_12725 [Ramlibacter sp.]|uniref:hypothetical protein n=1 Tax=Ramlibacter sp. TaxID=1917967 RepID=UPI002D809274|nr:hypothetical protein [Ramlibacter sp.]HET8746464.1 hypothetical protein [Ramlibacter sp.]